MVIETILIINMFFSRMWKYEHKSNMNIILVFCHSIAREELNSTLKMHEK